MREVRGPLSRDPNTEPHHADAEKRVAEDRADVVRGSRVTALVQLLNLAEPLLILAIVRLYGEAVWGQYILAESLAYAGTRLASLGLDRGMLWTVSRSREVEGGQYRMKGLAGSLVAGIASGTVVGTIGIALSPWLVGDLLEMPKAILATQITLAALPFTVALMIIVYTLLGTRAMGPDALVRTFLVPVAARVVPLALLPFALGSSAVAAGYLVANIAGVGFAAVLLKRRMKELGIPREPFAWPTAEVFRYSIQAGIADLMATLLVRVDVWMIAWLMTDAEVGIYGVIISLVASLRSIRSLVDRPIVPIMGEATAARDTARVRTLFSHATFMVACLTGPFLVLIWGAGREFLGIYGDRFDEGAMAMLVLSAGNMLVTVFGLASNVLTGAGRGGLLLFNSLLLMAINVVLNLVLIPYWGITGAAAATSIALASIALLEYLMARVIMRGSILDASALEPLLVAAIVTACVLPIYFVLRSTDDFLARMASLGVFAIVYGLWFWRRGLHAFRAK